MVDLDFSFYFKVDKNFSKNTHSFFGDELAFGTIQNEICDQLCQPRRISFLPLHQTGVEEFLLLKNLEIFKGFFSKQCQGKRIFIDLPRELSSLLPKLSNTAPEAVLVAPKEILQQGECTRDLFQAHGDRLFFFPPLESRRSILGWLADLDRVETMPFPWKTWKQDNSSLENKNPFLTPGGYLPWLANVLSHAQPDPALEAGAEIFLNRLLCQEETPDVLVIARSAVLVALAKAFALQKTAPSPRAVVQSFLKPKDDLALARLDPAVEHTSDPGFLCRDAVQSSSLVGDPVAFRKASYKSFFERAQEKYTQWTKSSLGPLQRVHFFRFSYRLSAVFGRFYPNSFDFVDAAKGVVDSNFAHEVLQECKIYPENPKAQALFPQVHVPLSALYDGTQGLWIAQFQTLGALRKQSQKPRLQGVKSHSSPTPPPPDGVSEDKYRDNSWVHEDHPYMCSFPNEDVFLEKLAFHIRDQVKERLRTQEDILREWQGDFCDGVDIRETIRNWHKEKIIIKDTLHRTQKDIGSVVFSFAPPELDDKYSWRTFWHAEKHDTAHLMFYATPFSQDLIGPGIAKSEFGGFAVIPLETFIPDPWSHPYFRNLARSAVDFLLLTAAFATPHRGVLFLSQSPPSPAVSQFLKRNQKHIIFVKMDTFSKDDIRRVRTFHILAEAGVRAYADKYIRKD